MRASSGLARGEAALAARSAATEARRGLDRPTLVFLPDPFRFDGRPLLARLRDKLGKLPVVGGLAASGLGDRAPVFSGEESSGHAVAGGLLTGARLRVTVAVAQGCRPITAAGK